MPSRKTTLGTIVQIFEIIGVIVITLTLVHQIKINRELIKFNENQIRPWMKVQIDSIYMVPINGISCRIKYRLMNAGNTPAMNVVSAIFMTDTNYTALYLWQECDTIIDCTTNVVFPRDTSYILSNNKKIYAKDLINYYADDEIRRLLYNEPLYVHIIVQYKFNQKIYHLYTTQGFEYLSTLSKNGITISEFKDWNEFCLTE